MRAQVISAEKSLAVSVPGQGAIRAVVIGPFPRGPLTPTLLGGEPDLLKRFTIYQSYQAGDPINLYSAATALEIADIYCSRVVNGAKYGGAVLAQSNPLPDTIEITADSVEDVFTVVTDTTAKKEAAELLFKFLSTGDRVTFSQVDGAVPAGITEVVTEYFVIPFSEDNFQFKVAGDVYNAFDDIAVDITDNGSGTISITLVQDESNKSVEYAMTNVENYVFDSSDGKVSGLYSEFTCALDRDSFAISTEFAALVETGDRVQLTASEFPGVVTGDALAPATDYYLIKVVGKEEVKLARTLSDAQNGILIDLTSTGDTIVGVLQDKTHEDATVTPANATNDFTVAAEFYAAAVNGDSILYDCDTTYPTVDSGDALDNTTLYYIIKSSANKVQLARMRGGQPITFSADGSGTHTFTIQNKTNTSSLETDLSYDLLEIDETFYEWIDTGEKVAVRSDTILPLGLAEGTDYYAIKVPCNDADPKYIKLAASEIAANAGVAVEIDGVGSGIHTIYNMQNETSYGLDRKCILLYAVDPGAWISKSGRSFYVTCTPYPYGDADSWSEQEQLDADAVKLAGCFNLYVWRQEVDDTVTLLEEFTCSRDPEKKDGYGRNIYVEEILESSYYIRAIDNTAIPSEILPQKQDIILKLARGDDGDPVGDGNMIAHFFEHYENRRSMKFQLALDGGWTTPSWQKEGITKLAEIRQDFLGIFSAPLGDELSTDPATKVKAYRKSTLNANTSYCCLTTPHALITNKHTNATMYIPPDGLLARCIAQNAMLREIWLAAAGENGRLQVLDLAARYSEAQEDELYAAGINPIDFYEGKGIRIWGNKTLWSIPEPRDRISTRLLLIVIRPAIAEALEAFLFKSNNELTWAIVTDLIDSYMDGIKARGGVVDYYTVCDRSNNPDEDQQKGFMNVDLFVAPTMPIEYIKYDTIISRTKDGKIQVKMDIAS